MAKEVIRLTEAELSNMIVESVERVLQSKGMLNEEPYSPNPYFVLLDTHARIAYIHLAKIFLFGNSTNDANIWLTHALNAHTIPFITSTVTTGNKTKKKTIKEVFITNFFGENFEKYEEQMRNFCEEAETEVQEGCQEKYHQDAPPHRTIENAMAIGKEIVIAFANKVLEIYKCTDIDTAKSILIPFMQEQIKQIL